MIRRLLAFVLAGCMVFESAPITGYAAEPETQTVMDDSEQTDESYEETESTENVSGESESETEVSIPLTKQEDGNYTFETEEYKLSLKAEEGFNHLRFRAAMEAKEGKTLDSGYVLRIYYKAQDGSLEDTADIEVNAKNKYSNKSVKSVSADKEYSAYLVLMDSSGETIAQTESIVLHTKPEDESVVVYGVKSTKNSITLDVEADYKVRYCYYAPTDGSGDEQKKYVNSDNWEEYVFYHLKADTEYYFQFTDYYGSEIFTIKVSTAASTEKVVYTAVPADEMEGFGISLKADVSGYMGDAISAYLYYNYIDDLGIKRSGSDHRYIYNNSDITVAEDGSKSFSITAFIDGNEYALEAKTQYDITMQVKIGNESLESETKTVQTPDAVYNAEDVTLTLTQNADSLTAVDYAMTRPSNENNGTGSGKAYLYYRHKGDKEAYDKVVMNQASDSGTISGLQSGAEYEFILLAGGVKIEKTYTCPESIKLSRIGEGEVNAFDIVRTWKAESSDTLDETYYLRLYYWNVNSYTTLGNAVALNAENEYQTEFKTASVRKLKSDTDYDLKWTLSSSTDTDDTPLYTFFESVHTPKLHIVIEDAGGSYDLQKYKITLDKADVVNFADSDFGSLWVYAYISKAGSNNFRSNASGSLSNDDDYSRTFTFKGLEPDTDYEVSLRSSSEYGNSIEYAAVTFKTAADERTVTVTNTSAGLHNASLEYTLTGIPDTAEYGYIYCYINEKNAESDWEQASYNYFNGKSGHTGTFKISKYKGVELKDGTTYEYLIGLGSDDTKMSQLEKTITGEFTTAADIRALSGAGVSAGYTIAKASVNFGGNDYNIDSHIHLFYREKGEENWNSHSSVSTDSVVYSYNSTIEGLKSGTEYEYVFAVSDSDSLSGPDEVTRDGRKVSGTFKTKESKYTLSFANDESKLTYNEAVVAVTAEGSAEDDRISVILTLNDGNSGTAELKQSTGYKGNITFTNLLGGTEYTITGAKICVTEADSIVTIADIACEYKFTTKEPEAPTSIRLSQDKTGLNAAPIDEDGNTYPYEGYNQKTLNVTMEPQSAVADFDWVSSDTAVAVVDNNGVVYAVGAGTAVITVTSKYNKDVKETCEVIVKDYVVGAKKEDGTVDQFYYDTRESFYKGGCVEGIGLYERNADGTLTLLSDYEVSSDKKGIVSWDSETGRLNVLSVGSTRVTFEKTVAEGVSVAASFPLVATAGGKGFGITGFRSSHSSYKAVAGTEANSYILAYVPRITYKAIGEISPYQTFSPDEFTWTISDSSVATVNDVGVVTPLKAGDVVLTVTPNTFHTLASNKYVQDKVEITLHIRELPEQGDESEVYVLANTAAKIGDVAFPADWGEGWKWKYPDTPLVINGVNKSSYPFEAVYNGTEKYPCKATINVYIGRITRVYINEWEGSHAQTLEVSDGTPGADKISLSVTPSTQGKVSQDDYAIEIPEVNGLTIALDSNTGCYDVTAQKVGNYTINAVIKAKASGKVLAKASYKVKAVEGRQAVSITFKPDEASGVTMDAADNIIFNKVEDKKDFTLTATVKDRSGQDIDTVLQWKTSDKSVAAVAPASKQNTHTAKITVKGEGHTVITATAKDARGLSVTLNLEVQNHRPRVNISKATVNIAYDYDNTYGKEQARAAGLVEIVPVYNEGITNVKICDASGIESKDLSAVRDSGYNYLITPTTNPETGNYNCKPGNYNCKLMVTTSTGTEYSYDFKVSVVDKAPSLSAKMATAPNMFFKDSTGIIKLTTSEDYGIDYVTWEDQSDGVDNGFSMDDYGYVWLGKSKYEARIWVRQQSGIKVTKGKLTDTGVDKGTLTVKLQAYKKVYTFNNFKIKYTYKKPKLVTMSASSNVVPSVGQNKGYFRIYDKTNKRYIYYDDAAWGSDYYDEYTWDAEESVELSPDYGVYYTYNAKESTKKVNMTLDSKYWREPLNVVHTIKAVKPKAYLGTSQLVFNTAAKDSVYTRIYLKNTYLKSTYSIEYSDIVIEGANPTSKKMLDNDLFMITVSDDNYIAVEQNNAKLMGETIPAGTYSYKVTPYYKNPETGTSTALNTMTLKVKVVNKPVTVKVSPKGALDLTYGASHTPSDYKNYVVLVDPKFSNLGSGYYIDGYKLTGEYSEYFRLLEDDITYANKEANHFYITVGDTSKLKGGQVYRLAIEYTISTGSGDTFTVTSNTFKVKPKQSAPKVTVTNNNQTLYAGNDSMSRSYFLSAPSGYRISSAYGSIDCNKDGKADIIVSGNSSLTVSITDKDAVGASASGKSYSIPVTVRLTGRDGISKDVKVTVKVKVKR